METSATISGFGLVIKNHHFLTEGRNDTLREAGLDQTQPITGTTEFELITWLITHTGDHRLSQEA